LGEINFIRFTVIRSTESAASVHDRNLVWKGCSTSHATLFQCATWIGRRTYTHQQARRRCISHLSQPAVAFAKHETCWKAATTAANQLKGFTVELRHEKVDVRHIGSVAHVRQTFFWQILLEVVQIRIENDKVICSRRWCSGRFRRCHS
jgi:hypothetical protein